MRTAIILAYKNGKAEVLSLPGSADIADQKVEFKRLAEKPPKGVELIELWTSAGRTKRKKFEVATPETKPTPGVHHRATPDVSDETFHYDKNKKKTQ